MQALVVTVVMDRKQPVNLQLLHQLPLWEQPCQCLKGHPLETLKGMVQTVQHPKKDYGRSLTHV